MYISKTTGIVFVCVVVTITLSGTVFKNSPGSVKSGQQSVRTAKQLSHEEVIKRYPVAEFEEPELADPVKRAELKERKRRNDVLTFSEPSHEDEAVGWFPEKNFDFPALPINESDVILIGQVLSGKAHRSENKRGIFSEFEVRVDEVLKGRDPRVTEQTIIVERTGGFLKYPNGRKVLFFVQGYGVPAVGTRNVLFLKVAGKGFQIVTVYELSPGGVIPLDRGNQFQRFQGEHEAHFISNLRESIANAGPQ